MSTVPASGAAPMEPRSAARAAGLRYFLDDRPGISRAANGEGFRYRHASGRAVRDGATLARIRSLAIPPARTSVWICPVADGHLQATGRDARGRKQYRYHARWREIRDETKYGRLAAFARALPRIRRRVSRDLALPGLPRDKALATVVRLLDTTFMRVGNEAYARENDSYGLTTLRSRQVRVRGARLQFAFRGKSGVFHRIELADARLAAIVRRMQDLPGEELFRYVDDEGATRTVDSADVNGYLKDIAGADFTSKDFRTWAGTLLALEALEQAGAAPHDAAARKAVAAAIDAVSKRLGNTRAVCRKCYVHPAVLEGYHAGALEDVRGRSAATRLAALLERHARSETRRRRRSGADGRSLVPVLARSLGARARNRHRDAPAIARA